MNTQTEKADDDWPLPDNANVTDLLDELKTVYETVDNLARAQADPALPGGR